MDLSYRNYCTEHLLFSLNHIGNQLYTYCTTFLLQLFNLFFSSTNQTMGLLLPIHILTYGYTLGSTTFHSFIASIKALDTLPRRQFGDFQGAVLPIQFATQSIAPVVIALTAPYTLSTTGIALLVSSAAGGVANLAYLTPKCAVLKTKRWDIVDKDFNGDNEKAVASGTVASIDKEFGKWHGASMAANMVSIVAMAAYGFVLSGKLKV